ncbi:MAG: hypothetical protein ACOCQY_02995 [Halorhabdus sp.]
MPISVEEFENDEIPDVPSVTAKALAFLYTHPEKAYTPSEVATAIDEDVETTDVMLVRLLRQDIARQKGEYWIVEDTARAEEMYDIESILEYMERED